MGSGDAISVPGWLPHGSAGVWRPCPAAALTAGSHPLLSRADWQGSRDSAFQAAAFPHVHVASESQAGLFGSQVMEIHSCSLRPRGRTVQSYMQGLWSYTVWIRFWFCHFLVGCSTGSYLNSVPQFPHLQTREGEGEETVSCLRVFRKIKWVHTCRVFTAEPMGRISELRHCRCHYSQHWRLSPGDQRAGNSARLQEWLDGRTGKPTLGNCALSLSLSLVAEFLVPTCLPCSPLSGFLSLCLSWVSHGLSDRTYTIFHLGQIASLRSSSKFLG